jgi:hypothetical protein
METGVTHYMELLATNEPWNIIIFMAIPVIFAEYIAVTFVAMFLVVAHVAMIFGMLNSALLMRSAM